MVPQVADRRLRPSLYVCPCCHLCLVTWDPPTGTLDIFHKIGLWTDFWTGDVRLICQSCLGATEVLPEALVTLLAERFGFPRPATEAWPPRRRDGKQGAPR
jgi:hypothetical protein